MIKKKKYLLLKYHLHKFYIKYKKKLINKYMPSKITLTSVLLLYLIHIKRLHPLYIKKNKLMLTVMYLSLLFGIYYHYTGKLLYLDMSIVLLNLYLHHKYFPKINIYIFIILFFTIFARSINYKYGNNYSQSLCTVIIHSMGHLIFMYSYNKGSSVLVSI